MDCKQAAEFVSALYDGETVPREAAEHLGTCDACQARLKSYMEMGVELRRIASLEMPEAVKPFLPAKQQSSLTMWWHRGWEMMRIPRLAFAFLLAGIVVLGSSLAVVGVRAHGEGSVVLLRISPDADPEHVWSCALSTVDKRASICGSLMQLHDGFLTYDIKPLRKDGNRIQLGVRAMFDPSSSGPHSLTGTTLDNIPQKQYSFEPGETLQVDVAGLGTMAITGEWMDHVPAFFARNGTENFDPGPLELRIDSPLLIRNKQVAGDFEGGSASADKVGDGVSLVMPGEGRFLVSLQPFAGSVIGLVKLNRITFDSDGGSYTILTGTPITRSDKVWVRHEPNYKPTADASHGASIGAGQLGKL